MSPLIVFVKLVLMVELHGAETAAELLLFVPALDPLVPQQTIPPFVSLPATETHVYHVPNSQYARFGPQLRGTDVAVVEPRCRVDP